MKLSELTDIAALWHPTKNGNLTPVGVSTGSDRTVWWLCPVSGGEYRKRVSKQVNAGPISPFVSGTAVWTGYNDLATTNPGIAALWSFAKNGGLTPKDVHPSSNKKVWWLCPDTGGEYERRIREQVKSNGKSPFLSDLKALPGYNDLATTHPDIAALWHPTKNDDLTPQDVTYRFGLRAWWLCPESGGSYQQKVSSQVKYGGRSPFVAGREVLAGYNDLGTTHPDVAALWDVVGNGNDAPSSFMPGSTTVVWWVCPETGMSYRRRILDQVNAGPCSSFMTGAEVLPGYNDLASQAPEAAALWHPTRNGNLTPQDVTYRTGRTVWWLCPESGAEYERHVHHQAKSGGVSPYMVNKMVHPGYNDLASQAPDAAELWHPTKNGDLTPQDVTPGSHRKVWWLCPVTGEPYERMVHKQVGAGGTSPYMSNQLLLVGYNDLATTRPDIAAAWHPTRNGDLTPQDATYGTSRKVWWLCPVTGQSFQRAVFDTSRCGITAPQVSSGEQGVADFVESVLPDGVEVVRNDRSVIKPLELDIVVPDRKIAVEFNGVYWHSEDQGKDRRYHHDKWLAAKETGYQLITVWEDDWRDNRPVVEAMLRHKLGVDKSRTVGARKCSVVTLGYRETAGFLDRNHIQGSATGSVYFGLESPDGTLVAVAVYRRVSGELFLDRYATSCPVPGSGKLPSCGPEHAVRVLGGMGKLLKAGCAWGRDHGCERIITFSDHEVSDGGLYDRLGFTRDRELAPDYKYVYGGVRHHKFGFRLKRFREDPALEFQEGLSERELAELNGIPRVWDAGKTRHVLGL